MRQTHIKSKVLSIALAFLIAVTMTPCWAIMTADEASAENCEAKIGSTEYANAKDAFDAISTNGQKTLDLYVNYSEPVVFRNLSTSNIDINLHNGAKFTSEVSAQTTDDVQYTLEKVIEDSKVTIKPKAKIIAWIDDTPEKYQKDNTTLSYALKKAGGTQVNMISDVNIANTVKFETTNKYTNILNLDGSVTKAKECNFPANLELSGHSIVSSNSIVFQTINKKDGYIWQYPIDYKITGCGKIESKAENGAIFKLAYGSTLTIDKDADGGEGTFIGNIVLESESTANINAGWFDRDVSKISGVTLPEDYGCYQDTNPATGTRMWHVTNEKPESYVAQIGSEKYETLQATFEAAVAGDTVEVLAETDEVVDLTALSKSKALMYFFNPVFDVENVDASVVFINDTYNVTMDVNYELSGETIVKDISTNNYTYECELRTYNSDATDDNIKIKKTKSVFYGDMETLAKIYETETAKNNSPLRSLITNKIGANNDGVVNYNALLPTQYALVNGVINVDDNIKLTHYANRTAGHIDFRLIEDAFKFDLNGHTIYQVSSEQNGNPVCTSDGSAAIRLSEYNDVTIDDSKSGGCVNGSIAAIDYYGDYSHSNKDDEGNDVGGILTLDGGTLIGRMVPCLPDGENYFQNGAEKGCVVMMNDYYGTFIMNSGTLDIERQEYKWSNGKGNSVTKLWPTAAAIHVTQDAESATIILNGGNIERMPENQQAPGNQEKDYPEIIYRDVDATVTKTVSNDMNFYPKDYVAQIEVGETTRNYETLAEAFAAANELGTAEIKMIADTSFTYSDKVYTTVESGKNITLDLNGKVITSSGTGAGEKNSALIENKGTLTIKDSVGKDAGGQYTGKIIHAADPTWEYGGDGDYSSSYQSNVIYNNPGTLYIEGGYIENASTAGSNGGAAYVIDNSSNLGASTTVIDDGELVAAWTAIRLFANSSAENNMTVNDGTINAKRNDILVHVTDSANKANLTINAGTFTTNKDGTSGTSAPIQLWQTGTTTLANIEVNGGFFKTDGGAAQKIVELDFKDAVAGEAKKAIRISDGYFNLNDTSLTDYVVAGKTVIDTPEGSEKDAGYIYTIGKKPVAEIGTGATAIQYTTLAAAIAAVQNNEIIKILCDINDATGISVDTKGKIFTIDFQGHEYTVNKPGAGSTGTTTQAFQLKKDQTITFKNGIIRCNKENLVPIDTSSTTNRNIKRIIQNYANLTLENMTIDGTNLCVKAYNGNLDTNKNRAVIESACGNVYIKGSTTIIDKMGDVNGDVAALNVVNHCEAPYLEGTQVTIGVDGDTGNVGEIGTIRCFKEKSTAAATKSSLTVYDGKIQNIIEANEDGTATTDCVPNNVTVQLNGGIYAAHLEKEVYYDAEHTAVKNTDEKTNADYPWTVGEKQDQKVIVTTRSGLKNNEGTGLKDGTEHIANLSGGGKYAKETDDVTLKAAPIDNFEFIGWYKDSYVEANLVSSNLEYTFKAPARDTEYIAVYQAKETKATVSVTKTNNEAAESGTVTVKEVKPTEEGGGTEANVDVGSKVELTASVTEGNENKVFFICWKDSQSGAVVSTNSTFQTTVLKTQTVEATFLKEGAAIVNFNDDTNNLIQSGLYAASEAGHVTDVVAVSKKGQAFKGWLNPMKEDDGYLKNSVVKQMIQTAANEATERAKAGGSALGTVNVKAGYEEADTYKIVLNLVNEEGTSVGAPLTVEKNIGEAVVLTAIEREDGLQFKGFSNSAPVKDTECTFITNSYKLTLNPDTKDTYTYYAVYGEKTDDIVRNAVITMGTPYDASTSVPKIGLTMSWALPEGATLVEAGFFYGYGENLAVPTAEAYRFKTTLTDLEGSFTCNVNVSGIQQYQLCFAGYVKYQVDDNQYLVVNGTQGSTGGEKVESESTILSGDKVTSVTYNGHNPAWKYDNNTTTGQ